jgi:toxin YoeB
MYSLKFTDQALEDLKYFAKSNPPLYKRARKLLEELQAHPTTGSGKPEKLKLNLTGKWSRRINREYRLVYEVMEDSVVVYAARYHY